MNTFEYILETSGHYGFDSYYDSEGNVHSSPRKCFIDALQRNGITDLPFETMTEYVLEMLCLQYGIHVKFLEY